MDILKGFTTGKKGRLYGLTFVLLLMVLLAGCGNGVSEIHSDTPGFFNHYVVFPLSYTIQHMASWFGGSYGMAIIGITLVVRLALFPLMMKQAKSQQGMKRIMNKMQPELDQLKKKYENKKEPAEQQKMQQEMMALYKKHNFNPLNIGCLPILIQLPILSGMYTAIRLTPELSTHSFLWFKLGQPDWIMAIVVAVLYLFQAKVSQKTMTPEQQKQMAVIGYLSPIMMAFFSFSAPAAMPLYWMVSGSFLLIQTLVFQKMYPADVLPAAETAEQAAAQQVSASKQEMLAADPAIIAQTSAISTAGTVQHTGKKSGKKRKNRKKSAAVAAAASPVEPAN